ncbi:MAG: hypothetical protein M1814_004709 [Vezdaea aestivalis]|nr:MAG: hypothetical protein M1814_004709 [Vezdaea aestivalis]
MAFKIPQVHASQRSQRVQTKRSQLDLTGLQSNLEPQQEWVLFSPTSNTHKSSLQAASTDKGAGLSHFSEVDSLISTTKTHEEGQPWSLDENEGDLDSLDGQLHAFDQPDRNDRSNDLDQSGGAFLPGHDGLGMFTNSGLFERDGLFRGRRADQSNVEGLQSSNGTTALSEESERIRRIQEWRMEHSRIVLDETEKESKKRRSSQVTTSLRDIQEEEDTLGSSMNTSTSNKVPRLDGHSSKASFHDFDSPTPTLGESLWQRITTRLLKSLVGLDRSLLSLIIGDSSLTDLDPQFSNPSELQNYSHILASQRETTWEDRLFERIARELGIIAAHHPSDSPTTAAAYPYPENRTKHAELSPSLERDLPPPETQRPSAASQAPRTPSTPHFAPTLPFSVDKSSLFSSPPIQHPDHDLAFERDYWERDLDVKMVFGFIRRRFSSAANNAPSATARPTSQGNPLTMPAAARAALIRAQHPLASRGQEAVHQRRRSGSARLGRGLVARRSSCRSLSVRSSSISGSSRNFWDLGGSVGGASAGGAGVGAWGEA